MRSRALVHVAFVFLVFVAVNPAPPATADEADESFDFRREHSTALPDMSSAHRGENASHGFIAWIGAEGLRLRPRGEGEPAWELGLTLVRVGRGMQLRSPAATAATTRANRAELDRGAIVEWYLNDERGLEQGFTLRERPEGPPGEPLVLELTLGTALVARAKPGGLGFDFMRPSTPLAVLSYGGLLVTDRLGREIPARMEIVGEDDNDTRLLRIVIDDRDAVYPLTVDPLLTTASWSSAETDETRDMAWGDWDGDGDLDLAVGNNGANRVYRNDGGVLTSVWTSVETAATLSIAWGDWDGDGDLDLAAGNNLDSNHVYSNDGLGLPTSLTLVWTSVETDATRSIAWADWNGDGDLDLAVGNDSFANRLYSNDGLGQPTSLTSAWTSADTDATKSIAWADWDGDGDLDLAAGNTAGQANRIYGNDGLGQPTSLTSVWTSTELDKTEGVAWGDWNGDGNMDLAIGNWDQANRVYTNDGLGNPTSLTSGWTSGDTDSTINVAWGDWDGDGDLDLAAASNGARRVYENDGLGQPTSLTEAWTIAGTHNTQSVAWGDWDNDGDLDLAVGNRDQANRIYENTGGAMRSVWTSIEIWSPSSLAWGDWDGDGDLDLAATGDSDNPTRVYENDGLGQPTSLTSIWTSIETENASSLAWGDWDGDGDLDLAVGDTGGNRVYENDGLGLSGSLVSAWTSAETGFTSSLAWGDWDGDGDLDLAATGDSDNPNRVYENDRLGQLTSLTSIWTSADIDPTIDVKWGDWDGDGDLDLAAGNTDQTANRVYENDGLGQPNSLTSIWTSADIDHTGSVKWGDWDGDGDLDLAAGNWTQADRVYENDGIGQSTSLTSVWSSPEEEATTRVTWVDWDGDGDLDLAAVNFGQDRVYENDGLGQTNSLISVWNSPDQAWTIGAAWGDWNGDGDLDLAVGEFRSSIVVYDNGYINRSGLLPESPVSPVLALRPGTTDGAFFHSTPECLTSPISIPFTLVDEESDPARRITVEYSLTGGGSWTPATEGPGGNGTVDLAASPGGTPHTFVWDSLADGVIRVPQVSFRISVPYQASQRLAGPIQRAAMATTSPPFRVEEPTADLAVAKNNGIDIVYLGDTVVWTITVTNEGPHSVADAHVTDTFSASMTGVVWTCVAGSGSSCGNPSGSGDLDELVALERDSSITFVAFGTVTNAAMWGLSNTATVSTPSGVIDTDPSNNSATDTDLGWGIFIDDFETGNTTAWSTVMP